MDKYLPYLKSILVAFFALNCINSVLAIKNEYATHSVLSSGKWYKVGVQKEGIYKLSYSDFVDMGLLNSSVKSERIRVFGNGSGMLPESSSIERIDDLIENAIMVHDGGDGNFGSGDYILFYGEDPVKWKYNEDLNSFEHTTNIYAENTCYFINVSSETGKRVSSYSEPLGSPVATISNYTDFRVHELEKHNLVGTGREWYGELFDFETEYSFNFSFPDIVDTQHEVCTRLAGRSGNSAEFIVNVHNTEYSQIIGPVTLNDQDKYYAKTSTLRKSFSCNQAEFSIKIENTDLSGNTLGWIDYIELNIHRKINLRSEALLFSGPSPSEEQGIIKISVSNAGSDAIIWDVTDHGNIKKVIGSNQGGTRSFLVNNDEHKRYVAFRNSMAQKPEFIGKVQNQNLHSIEEVDYVIISPDIYKTQAEELAEFHRSYSILSTLVIDPQEIYNEFSSGAQDITAIRDFLKMIYDKSNKEYPKYVLFYGDGSYDYKSRIENNSNRVPTWQSQKSLHPIHSYATDDFFALLDDGETLSNNNGLDVGIGRFPVSTTQQAKDVLNKILHYHSNDPNVMKDWRNDICFVADDEELNSHMRQAEDMAEFVSENYPLYNLDKIYLDAFVQESTPSGQRYPDANTALNNRIKKGALIVNYTGHGGETGWTHEKVLTVADINSWRNIDNLPVFITATCEFSRFDDPKRTSAGEYVLLNAQGGGIALFTTTRATYGLPNFSLNLNLYKNIFKKENGRYPTLGELFVKAKKGSSNEQNSHKFILLGDPAMKLHYPEYHVETEAMVEVQSGEPIDTLKALDRVILHGKVVDDEGTLLSNFNGTCQVKILDKKQMLKTLANGGESEFYYESQKNIIYRGVADVNNGRFSCEFVVPKDIFYNYGAGKICYYAHNHQTDAAGYDNNYMVGGYSANAVEDYFGPEISVYMNNEEFHNGGITDENPIMYLFIEDENGINTMGTGIGHDIMMVFDSDYEHPVILNDFYESAPNAFGKGSLIYPFFGLKPGIHKVWIKVWDSHNNSSHTNLEFEVMGSKNTYINDVFNYPNPFSDVTYFNFEHNQPEQNLKLTINIYDLTGVLVQSYFTELSTSGYLSRTVSWDGKSFNGKKLDNGVYVYRVSVETEKGVSQILTKKLVLIK